jgi:hypothetical protein
MTNSEIIAAIGRIVAYNWADEKKDYNHEALEEGNSREGHIFGDLMRVQRWLEKEHGYPHVEPFIMPHETSTAEWFAKSKALGCTGTGFDAETDTIEHEGDLPCPVHPGL